jgi:hypothetical protein
MNFVNFLSTVIMEAFGCLDTGHLTMNTTNVGPTTLP